jgi:hypothetical protein
MPSWMPEGDTAQPGDNEIRSLAKWCSILVTSIGNRSSMFPEGCIPLPSDNEARLLQKIKRLTSTS